MNNVLKLTTLMAGKKNIQNTPLVMAVTTTGAQTLTLENVAVATGKTVVVDWGDGGTDTYTAGSGARTHAYTGAGVWIVKLSNRGNITELNLQDTKITSLVIDSANPLPAGLTYLFLYNLSGVTYDINSNPLPTGLTSLTLGYLPGVTYNVNSNPLPAGLTILNLSYLLGVTYNVNSNPLPAGLTYLRLNDLPGVTYNVNSNPLPAGLTHLYLYNLPGVTWIINAAQPWPTGATTATVAGCPHVTCTAWTDNAIRSIRAENAYSQANIDAFLSAILANKANFTYSTPTLDLLGGDNAAPSGTYQAADPVTSGNEAAYALVNGNGSYAPGPEWVVQTA